MSGVGRGSREIGVGLVYTLGGSVEEKKVGLMVHEYSNPLHSPRNVRR